MTKQIVESYDSDRLLYTAETPTVNSGGLFRQPRGSHEQKNGPWDSRCKETSISNVNWQITFDILHLGLYCLYRGLRRQKANIGSEDFWQNFCYENVFNSRKQSEDK